MTDYEIEDAFPTSTGIPSDQVSASVLPSSGSVIHSNRVLPKPASANGATPFAMSSQMAELSSSHTGASKLTTSSTPPISSAAKTESTESSVMHPPIPAYLSTSQIVSAPPTRPNNAPPKPAAANAATPFTMNSQMAQPSLLSVPTNRVQIDEGTKRRCGVFQQANTPFDTVDSFPELWKHGVNTRIKEPSFGKQQKFTKPARKYGEREKFRNLWQRHPKVFETMIGFKLQNGYHPREMMDDKVAAKCGEKWMIDWRRVDDIADAEGLDMEDSYKPDQLKADPRTHGNEYDIFSNSWDRMVNHLPKTFDEAVCE